MVSADHDRHCFQDAHLDRAALSTGAHHGCFINIHLIYFTRLSSADTPLRWQLDASASVNPFCLPCKDDLAFSLKALCDCCKLARHPASLDMLRSLLGVCC